jgi:hypothetical protein
MSRPITLADLEKALAPINKSIEIMRQENTSNSTQINEIHSMTTSLSVKLDTLGTEVHVSNSNAVRTPPKKLSGRKGAGVKKAATKKAPAKRGAKKTDVADETDDGEQVDEESAAEEEETDVTSPSSDSKAKVVKKTVAKAESKETKKTKAKKEEPKKVTFNKMNYFKKEFERDEEQFSKIFTAKVKKAIESSDQATETIDGKTGDALKKARAGLYYHYLKDNHADTLDALRAKFDEENVE